MFVQIIRDPAFQRDLVTAGRGVSEASRGCSPCGLCGS